ncbi:MAG: rod shape-determining protein RodA [Cyanobacteria bacterium]|jgi:rod shape determining protein RodA|uniref:rod shape-determining protein RodA n=1 Tax=Synechococcus sp. MVIR-18-1 TaxID=1386941 RepID=UPI00164874FD|nr:rod shape-determining protein RodA [Synechococcus sp. MVIR-18-1]MCH9772421.1 rod shape-determining protein RodA [Cyanobacteriota bacterium]MDB4336699.1 rod shape-determining protein RodA [Synechococcus sp. AH-603-M21]MDC0257056.1 rod shape-determining protein RodA [Synechococcus sp. AH-551-P10]MDC0269258.1 rod shape-determining protein RodA [Synechococcus sp. AH-551-N23]
MKMGPISREPGLFTLNRQRKGWRLKEPVLWGVPLAMVMVAGLLIASTQRQADYADWYHHWITAAVGVVIALVTARLPLLRLKPLLIPIYAITVISLVAVRLIGTTALGAQRWLSIGGVHVQPSEFAKLSAILLLAAVLDRHPVERPVDLLRPLGIISIPWLLVFIQPDLGTSLVFGALLLTMLYWSGMPIEWLVLLLSPLATALLAGLFPWGLAAWVPLTMIIAYRSLPWKRVALALVMIVQSAAALVTPWLWMHGLQDYQRDRLVLFLDPAKDPLGGGYHLLQSTVGIGSGGLFGMGLLQGQLTKLRFIPEQHTDFIFSALGEETGFLGTILVVIGFALLMGRLLQVAGQSRSDFESLVVIGVATMLMFQVVVNIFMTIGLGPVTGIPLPFMSYGRSAMVVNFLALGLCLSVSRRSKRSLNR